MQWTGIILYEQQARQGVFIKFTSLIFSGCVVCDGKVQKLPGNIIQNKNLERCLNFALSKTSTDASVSGLHSSWLFNKHNLGIQIQKG